MTNPAKRRGDRAELEVQGLLQDLLGVPARRQLGAGRKDDIGDIAGLPDTVVQVCNYKDIGRAIREKLPETVVQQERAGSLFGALFCRRRGGGFVVVLTPEMWATLWREAQPVPSVAPSLDAALDLLARVPYESGLEIGELIEERRTKFECVVDESAGLKDESRVDWSGGWS